MSRLRPDELVSGENLDKKAMAIMKKGLKHLRKIRDKEKRLPKNSWTKYRNEGCNRRMRCGKSWTITSSRVNQEKGGPGL